MRDYRQAVEDKSRIAQMVFGGFKRCLYPVQKFQSDSERKLAIILDREALKWFKPAVGQFRISYKVGSHVADYQPDFVAETKDKIYMLEPKARNELDTDEVQAKKASAKLWCERATAHNKDNGGKPWEYMLIPHDVIAEKMDLPALRNATSR